MISDIAVNLPIYPYIRHRCAEYAQKMPIERGLPVQWASIPTASREKNRDGIESQFHKQIEVTVPSAPAEVPSIETPAEKRRTECYAYQIEVTRCCAPADTKKYSDFFWHAQLQSSGKAVSIRISTESTQITEYHTLKKCDRYRIDRMLLLVGLAGFEPATKGL